MKISLIGYMGSGKSTIGKRLAEKLNQKFIDLDVYIEQENNETIQEIFSRNGEIKFRKLERDAMVKTLNIEEDFVIALGGGTPAYYNNTELINERTFSVYLRLSIKEIIERLKNEKNRRPLIAHLDDEHLPEFIAKHLFERRIFYERANLTIDVNEKTVEKIVSEIIQNLPPRK